MSTTNGARRGWLGVLADEADSFVQGRIEHLAATARQQSGRLAEHAAERFAQHLAERVTQRLGSQLAWGAVAVGALVIAVWLLVLGTAGALGDLLGRPWLGQLVAGAITLLVALAAAALVRARMRGRR